MENTVYTLIKLNKGILVDNGNGNIEEKQIDGLFGFLPVYQTYEEAFAESENGVFQIVSLIIQNNSQEEVIQEPNQDSEEIQSFE
jgi:hypothetical protein